MVSLLEQIERGTLWQFPGGIHPPECKSISNHSPITRLPLPEKLVIPIKQHIGANGRLLVAKGDLVLKGQPLTVPNANWSLPVHAPTSGEIVDICSLPSAHPSALPELSIVLKPDGKDVWQARSPREDYRQLDKKALVDIIHNAGIAGMGGAGFPTYIKADSHQPIEYLVVNGVECEPYITADDCLMREKAAEIIQGIEIMQYLLNPARVIIGIEDNKPEALSAMREAAAHNDAILVRSIPTKYPSGGEKQLIRVLTSKEVPSQGIPADIGVLVQNVGTLFAVYEAVMLDKPLIERVVTVTGNTITRPANVWALLGTEVKHLLDCQGFTPVEAQRVVMGGPMMGFTLPTVRIPVVKTTNCILAPDNQELAEPGDEKACIRCSACADACPQSLLPQQLQWFAKGKEYDKLETYNLFDCIECGACSYVCPSEIPLVQYYRVAKAEIREQKLDKVKAERAKVRFEARKERLEKDMAERQNRHKRAAEETTASAEEQAKIAAAAARVQSKQPDKSAVQAAIERAKAKKAQEGGELVPDNSQVALEREKRKAQARQYKAEKAATEDDEVTSGEDKKAAVAAAIARAKAKKAALNESVDTTDAASNALQPEAQAIAEPTTPTAEPEDKRKTAVAAAIARAKAKKAALNESVDTTDAASNALQPEAQATAEPTTPTAEPEDKRKAAVAAAIARAKAKKAALNESVDMTDAASNALQPEAQATATPTAEPEDKRKAAVAAAIARAKAKKAALNESVDMADAASNALQPEAQATAEPTAPTAEPEDKRKAAVAAAIARAKAKKAAQAQQEQTVETPTVNVDEPTALAAEDNVPEVCEPAATSAEDKRKAAVAAAIARAKAKKAAQQAQSDQPEGNDPS
ncbi:electron transport complex subunit RsxC [Pseudoalteromonas fenneropenaei]|uniref:Ion-translocating oxidoreductase complex subunit C n=1 Tax=Pseudoalteromonas fenneropenaei TaxID=1737459 RepID=A0ABV7CMK0_9GAMM